MGYKSGIDKKQLSLLPECLDDYVPEDHICRIISEFTRQLDVVALGYKYAESKTTGCPPYDPRMMLNLYIYGYMHRVRSSRRLRDEATRNIEVMWLMDGLKPDDKTICNFRKDNTKALRETFRTFVRMCRNLGLYGEETVALDGTKFRANSSLANHYNKTVVKNELGRIDKKISEYMEALEKGDLEEAVETEPSVEQLKAALERLKERKEHYEELNRRVKEEGEVSTVDADARLMHSSGDGRKFDVGYNAQTVVDSKYYMIVDFEVRAQPNDAGNLHTMMERAKDILEVDHLTCLADKGYYSSQDIAACEQSGVTCLVAKTHYTGSRKAKGFNHEDFLYDREKDVYICPCKNELRRRYHKTLVSGRKYQVYSNAAACARCEKKPACTEYHYRDVSRLVWQDVMDIVDKRTRENKELYQKRREIVEHPYGTIKAVWGYKQFLCRTKPKVIAETALAYLAYNMRRMFNIFTEAKVKPVFT